MKPLEYTEIEPRLLWVVLEKINHQTHTASQTFIESVQEALEDFLNKSIPVTDRGGSQIFYTTGSQMAVRLYPPDGFSGTHFC
jgi:hypothetical protein